jgi:hypothetical protein
MQVVNEGDEAALGKLKKVAFNPQFPLKIHNFVTHFRLSFPSN